MASAAASSSAYTARQSGGGGLSHEVDGMEAAAAVESSSSSSSSVHDETTEVLLEFLEVAIHAILYQRQVYPKALFERRRKYNVATHMSRHPELNDYIFQVLLNAKMLLTEGVVDSVIVAILGPHGLPVERYTFEVSTMADAVACTCAELEDGLAAVLTKLSMLGTLCPDPVPGAAGLSIDKDKWVQLDATDAELAAPVAPPAARHQHHQGAAAPSQAPVMYPIKSLRAGHLWLQLMMEVPDTAS